MFQNRNVPLSERAPSAWTEVMLWTLTLFGYPAHDVGLLSTTMICCNFGISVSIPWHTHTKDLILPEVVQNATEHWDCALLLAQIETVWRCHLEFGLQELSAGDDVGDLGLIQAMSDGRTSQRGVQSHHCPTHRKTQSIIFSRNLQAINTPPLSSKIVSWEKTGDWLEVSVLGINRQKDWLIFSSKWAVNR